MKRRLLLVDGVQTDCEWIAEQVRSRFKSMGIISVCSLNDAHKAIVETGCDIIVAGTGVIDSNSIVTTIHTLQAYALGVPVIVLTDVDHNQDHEAVMDVVATGVRHILYKSEVRQDFGRFIGPLVDTIRHLHTRETSDERCQEQVRSLSRKVWSMDDRVQLLETNVSGQLATVASRLETLTAAVDKRGGLEDRVTNIEKQHGLIKRVAWAVVGFFTTAIGAIASAVTNLFAER